eukprot:SAG25_NODE_189_length_12334_cov_8.994279_12_plen_70_part_00
METARQATAGIIERLQTLSSVVLGDADDEAVGGRAAAEATLRRTLNGVEEIAGVLMTQVGRRRGAGRVS